MKRNGADPAFPDTGVRVSLSDWWMGRGCSWRGYVIGRKFRSGSLRACEDGATRVVTTMGGENA